MRNNARAQRALYEKHKVKWFMICLRYAHNKAEAEDMLQEGLISVFKDLRQFDPGKAAFSAWSNKVMVNAALQHLRKWKKLSFDQQLEDYENQLVNNDDVMGSLGTKELMKFVQRLPDGYRVVFNLYVIEGYKHKEIAAILSISESTSKTQLLKAKKMLRNQLETVLEY
ncbi:MAG: sigma-70 family RNA polymerase sigma factor [Bacteroidales bacterium]|nr:sigma-70 family RNA polymerase sigma factor [Bacteroidales bacterium]